jgi:hypothetical protein
LAELRREAGSARFAHRQTRKRPRPPHDNRAALALSPATANTLPGFPEAFFIGGDPLLLVEPLPDEYVPLEPSASLPRPPLRMHPDDVGPPPPDLPPEPVT